MAKNRHFFQTKTISLRNKVINFSNPAIMGILNLTPDSFSDGGKYTTPEAILMRAGEMIEEGADIIDMGAVSTRPGSEEVPLEIELERLIPAITLVRKTYPDIPISADTFRAAVAQKALDAGADMINDIYGSSFDPNILQVVAAARVPYVMMHIQGNPKNMQKNPVYKDVVVDVLAWLSEKANFASRCGVNDIIIDPGFGFGKSIQHNFSLLNNIEHFCLTNYPVLLGISRKSFIYKTLNTGPNEVSEAICALHLQALLKGVSVLRVHDVRLAKQMLTLHKALKITS